MTANEILLYMVPGDFQHALNNQQPFAVVEKALIL